MRSGKKFSVAAVNASVAVSTLNCSSQNTDLVKILQKVYKHLRSTLSFFNKNLYLIWLTKIVQFGRKKYFAETKQLLLPTPEWETMKRVNFVAKNIQRGFLGIIKVVLKNNYKKKKHFHFLLKVCLPSHKILGKIDGSIL